MTEERKQEALDRLWFKAMEQALKADEPYTRFRFAALVAAEKDTEIDRLTAEIERLTAENERLRADAKRLTDEEIDAATAKESDDLLDHIYEYGTIAEGTRARVRKLARAAIDAAMQETPR